MKTTDRRRRFQLESLENRSLLSVVVPHPAAEVGSIHAEKVRVVSGQITGKVTSTTPISPIEFMVTVKGTGTAKGYGPVRSRRPTRFSSIRPPRRSPRSRAGPAR